MGTDKIRQENCFTYFKESTESYSLPERFTFPFNYEPHPLCRLAAKELQFHIENQKNWRHDFGIGQKVDDSNSGKMFGVLIVRNEQDEIGYLAAFSGILAGKTLIPGFVPPIFDTQRKDGFFKKEEDLISQINHQIKTLEEAQEMLDCKKTLESENEIASSQLKQKKKELKEGKQARKKQREKAKAELSPKLYEALNEDLIKESQRKKYEYKQLSRYWKEKLLISKQQLDLFLDEISQLKKKRKKRSAALQQKLFDQYQFLNKNGEEMSVCDIFKHTSQKVPPSGAGDCAAPKLLQYAFQHNMKPIAMAEFWWGQSPKTEIRKHANFYPSCRGKCEPILGHMLKGIKMDENPLMACTTMQKEVEIVFEDDVLLVVNKPADFLSVPGKEIEDSVYLRMKQKFPEATGPMIVHRLDMSTSGLMMIAKSKETHKKLQSQFLNRTITKRYIALLDGIVKEDEGTINLPLRVDLEDRPRQLVCYEHGKNALTKWNVVKRTDKRTLVQFYPITGRTHQLRVHSAHPLGLNIPIVGDDLYGQKANRLHLHAEYLEFKHPENGEIMKIQVDTEFLK